MPISLRLAANTVIYYHSLTQHNILVFWQRVPRCWHDAWCQPKSGNERRRPKAPSTVEYLLTKSECCDDFAVSGELILLQVRQKILALCNEHDQTTT